MIEEAEEDLLENKMTQEKISIISTLVNLLLAVFKLIIGLTVHSMALIADAIHSGMDVFSPFIAFLGIKTAKKPVDEKHPYGYYRAETLAGFVIAFIIALSGIAITYKGINQFFKPQAVIFTFWAIGLMIVSCLVNEGMARLKFYYGRKYESISLVADAEHSRVDVVSSLGVLLGLILIKYFIYADAIVAILIGLYIIWESIKLGKEITDSLLDVSNKDIENRIRKICSVHKIEISELKTRKIGAFNFSEIKIKLPPKLKVEDVQKITGILEERLLKNIPELKQIVISIEAYQMARTVILPKFGEKIGKLEGFEQIGPKKLGERIIIPLKKDEVSDRFGAVQYLVIDIKEGKILTRETLKNPYFEGDSPHGARFAKAIRTDKVFLYQIGENAKQNLENFGIEVEIIPPEKKLEDIIEEIKTSEQ